ncbi:MAG: hypothetical protein GY941_02905, partial [Planctomycetes bacterium]|nr:hypothetical protein [Planctomycetota bacterium]
EEATWTFESLGVGESVTIQVNATVTSNLVDGTLITVPVRVSAADSTSPAIVERTVAVSSTETLRAALGTDRDPVGAGEPLTYTVDVGNRDVNVADEVSYLLRLPLGVVFDGASDGGSFDATSREVSWSLGSLPAGTRLQRVVDVTVAADVPDGSLLVARGELRAGASGEAVGAQERTVAVDGDSLLAVGINAVPDPVGAGSTLALEFRVSNLGDAVAENVKLVFPVPTGLSFNVSSGAEPNVPDSCGNSTCVPGEEATWTFESLGVGESVTIQ